MACAQVAVHKALFKMPCGFAPGRNNAGAIIATIISNRITFGGKGNGGGQGCKVGIVQGASGRILGRGLTVFVADSSIKQHVVKREHWSLRVGQITAFFTIAAKAGIDQDLA